MDTYDRAKIQRNTVYAKWGTKTDNRLAFCKKTYYYFDVNDVFGVVDLVGGKEMMCDVVKSLDAT